MNGLRLPTEGGEDCPKDNKHKAYPISDIFYANLNMKPFSEPGELPYTYTEPWIEHFEPPKKPKTVEERVKGSGFLSGGVLYFGSFVLWIILFIAIVNGLGFSLSFIDGDDPHNGLVGIALLIAAIGATVFPLLAVFLIGKLLTKHAEEGFEAEYKVEYMAYEVAQRQYDLGYCCPKHWGYYLPAMEIPDQLLRDSDRPIRTWTENYGAFLREEQ